MHKYIVFSFLAVAALGCGSKIDDLHSERPTSNIPVTESDGVVTATISAAATSDQKVVGSPSSKAADTSATFPPGSLAVDTDIAIGEATDKASDLLTELGVDNAVQAGSPVYVGPAAGTPPDLSAPLTIQIPLPLEDIGLSLADAESKLVLIYAIYDNGWKTGMIPLTADNLLGAFVKQNLSGMGYFQIVYLATASGAKEEIASAVVPSLGKNAVK
jgi:hypothetical protein